MPEYEPKAGWYSRFTQKIANELPSWNKIRRRRDSVGQQLLNASAGRQMEMTHDEMERALRSKFPATIDLNEPDLVTKVELPNSITLNQPTKIQNYLLNSSFEIWPNQSALPQHWRSTGTGTIEVERAADGAGFIGVTALRLGPVALGQSIAIYQDVNQSIPAGQEWTFSAWYKVTPTSALTAPATGFGIEAIGYCVDATTETLRASFAPTTLGNLRRVAVTGSFTKAVTSVRVRLVVSRTVGFNFINSVLVDLVQAEEGDSATSWRPSPLEGWSHISLYSGLAPVWLEDGNRAQFVDSMYDFWHWAVPTRAEHLTTLTETDVADIYPSPVGGITSFGTAGRWLDTDFFGDDWAYTVEAYSQTGAWRLRMIGTDVPDILGTFTMAFRNYRDYFETGETNEIEAITYFGRWLWVVHQKADWKGNTLRYLSLVDPRTPWPRPEYLEAMVTIGLPTPDPAALITRVEFRHDDQQHLYMGDGHTTYVYNLFYDYFMLQDRTLYLREEPESVSIIEVEPTRRELTSDQDLSQMNRTRRRDGS